MQRTRTITSSIFLANYAPLKISDWKIVYAQKFKKTFEIFSRNLVHYKRHCSLSRFTFLGDNHTLSKILVLYSEETIVFYFIEGFSVKKRAKKNSL